MWDYSFMVPCAFMLLVILGFYFSKPRLPIAANRTFVTLLAIQLAVMTLDIVSSLVDENYQQFDVSVIYVANMLYFVLYLARIYWFYRFSLHVVHASTNSRVRAERYFAIPYYVAEAICVSSFVTGAVFSVGDAGYVRGPLYNILYVMAAFYIILSLVLVLQQREGLTQGELHHTLGFNAVLVAGNVVRFALPKLLSMDTFATMAILVIYLGIMNPDLFLFEQTRVFNRHGARVKLAESILLGDYHVLGVALQNYNQERSMLGGLQMDEVIARIAEWVQREFPQVCLCYLDAGRFALLGSDSIDWPEIRSRIYRRSKEPWETSSGVVALKVAFVSASPDSGLKSAEEILNMLTLALDTAQQDVGLKSHVSKESRDIREVDRQVNTLRALEHALNHNEVEVFLQPIYDCNEGRIVAAESLARIRNEDGSLVSPGLFIPIAEQTGYVNQLGEQVFEKTCEFIASNDMEALSLRWINVNLSPIQCMQPNLAERFSEILNRHGVSAKHVHLEITEQSMIESDLLKQQLKALEEAGFQFALDDYGTGYSNLARLKRYPFQNIKLDMSIVWDYCRTNDAMLPVVVRSFHDAGYSITAEGIETEQMAQALLAIEADYLQGYYYSKPLSCDEYLAKYGKTAA